ncbi:MAG: hypothetical protein AMXMBFR64_57580 [Myxococcales bacterium]
MGAKWSDRVQDDREASAERRQAYRLGRFLGEVARNVEEARLSKGWGMREFARRVGSISTAQRALGLYTGDGVSLKTLFRALDALDLEMVPLIRPRQAAHGSNIQAALGLLDKLSPCAQAPLLPANVFSFQRCTLRVEVNAPTYSSNGASQHIPAPSMTQGGIRLPPREGKAA